MLDAIPESWIPILKNTGSALLVIIVITIFYFLVLNGLKRATKKYQLAPSIVSIIRILFRWTCITFAVLFALDQFGILENIWAALLAVLAMVAVGFVAVWSILSNMLCTLLILIYKPFQVGSHIEIPADNLQGKVIDLNLMFTSLEEKSGDVLLIPNNTVFQKAIRRIRQEATRKPTE